MRLLVARLFVEEVVEILDLSVLVPVFEREPPFLSYLKKCGIFVRPNPFNQTIIIQMGKSLSHIRARGVERNVEIRRHVPSLGQFIKNRKVERPKDHLGTSGISPVHNNTLFGCRQYSNIESDELCLIVYILNDKHIVLQIVGQSTERPRGPVALDRVRQNCGPGVVAPARVGFRIGGTKPVYEMHPRADKQPACPAESSPETDSQASRAVTDGGRQRPAWSDLSGLERDVLVAVRKLVEADEVATGAAVIRTLDEFGEVERSAASVYFALARLVERGLLDRESHNGRAERHFLSDEALELAREHFDEATDVFPDGGEMLVTDGGFSEDQLGRAVADLEAILDGESGEVPEWLDDVSENVRSEVGGE